MNPTKMPTNTPRTARILALLVLFTLAIVAATPSWATLTATADRTVISSNETLQLLVRLDSQALLGEPEFSVLENDFEILSTSRQQQYSRVNGESQSFTDWNLVLAPKRSGRLLIPSINYKNDISDAIEITVRQATSASAAGQPVYTETLVDKSAVYIQEQLLLTHRLYTSVRLSDLGLDELKIDDALVQKVSETQFQKTVGGKNYLVVEIIYALFPQLSGKLEIPALRFAAYEASNSRFGGFSSRGNRIIRSTDAKTIDVMARPAHIDIDNWMPASNLSLQQEWSGELDQLRVGEPITRTIRITAKGLTAAQILPLPSGDSDDYKIYPDQPQLDERVDASGVTGIRRESFALVPNQPGKITLPEIKVRWWDTANQRMQTASIEAVTLQVTQANINTSPTAAGATEPQDSGAVATTSQPEAKLIETSERSLLDELRASRALQLSLAINGLMLLVLLVLLLRRPAAAKAIRRDDSDRHSARLELKQQLTKIERAVKRSDLGAVREGILAWGRCMFPDQSIKTLAEIAALLQQPPLQAQFDLLDRALYKGDGEAPDLKQTLHLLRNAIVPKRANTGSTHTGLKPLYPEP